MLTWSATQVNLGHRVTPCNSRVFNLWQRAAQFSNHVGKLFVISRSGVRVPSLAPDFEGLGCKSWPLFAFSAGIPFGYLLAYPLRLGSSLDSNILILYSIFSFVWFPFAKLFGLAAPSKLKLSGLTCRYLLGAFGWRFSGQSEQSAQVPAHGDVQFPLRLTWN